MYPDDPLTSDPAVLAAAFHRVADRLEAVRRDSEERDKATRRATRRWVLAGIVLAAAFAAVVYFIVNSTAQAGSARAAAAANRALATAAKAQAAAAERQDAAAVKNICASFSQLAALKPPPALRPGNDMSRIFLNKEHVVLVDIGTDLCGKPSGHS